MPSNKILGIDPGKNMGICIMEVDDYFNILSIEHTTFYILDMLDKHMSKGDTLNKSLVLVYDIVCSILEEDEFLAIARETEFVNFSFPFSGLSLARYIGSLEVAFGNKAPDTLIFRYAAREIKSGIGAGGEANKGNMEDRVLGIPELYDKIDHRNLDEHNVDAIAIAYLTVLELRRNPTLLLSI